MLNKIQVTLNERVFQMVVSQSKNRLHTIGLLSLLALCMVPAKITAENATSRTVDLIKSHKKILITASVTLTYLACSEKARIVANKATLNCIMASLQLLLKLPLTDTLKQSIHEKIDHLETIYTNRAGYKITSEDLKAMLKEFKELIDVIKAGKEVYGWIYN